MLEFLALTSALVLQPVVQTTPPRPWDAQDQAVVQAVVSECMAVRLDPAQRPTLPASWTDMGNGYGKLDRPDGSGYYVQIPGQSDTCQLTIVNGDLAATRAFVAAIRLPGLSVSADRNWFHWDRTPNNGVVSVDVQQRGATVQIYVHEGVVRDTWRAQDQAALATVLDTCTGFILHSRGNYQLAGWDRDGSYFEHSVSGRNYRAEIGAMDADTFSCELTLPWSDSDSLEAQIEALTPPGLTRRADGEGWAWYRADAAEGAAPVFRIAVTGIAIENPKWKVWISAPRWW